MINAKEVIEESLPVLTVCAAISIMSGMFLGNNQELLKALPGLLIIVPSFNAVNGNISSVMASRISSGLHMGLIKPRLHESGMLRTNVLAMTFVAAVSFLLLGLVAAGINSYAGIEMANFIVFPSITFTAGILTVVMLMAGSIFTSYLIYRHGIDPDNVVVPILTTIGDFVGISMLLLIASAAI